MPKKYTQFQLRAPTALIEAARKVAEVERRTVTAQIIIWIELGMPAELLDETRADISTALTGGTK